MSDLTSIAGNGEGRLRRRLAAGAHIGVPLSRPLRDRLERSFERDLRSLRVNVDAEADSLARAFGADAFTCGSQVFFQAGRFAPDTPAGYRLLAHEVAHAIAGTDGRRESPATGAVRVSAPHEAAEHRADEAADAASLGAKVPGALLRPDPGAGRDLVVHRHASWEHRLLGDARSADLNTIAKRLGGRTQLLTQLRDFLWMWHQDPDAVTPQKIAERCPYIRTLRLKTSGLLVTYGELNTLPDYMANPTVLDAQPRSILLPILQAVRQEGYNRVQRLLDADGSDFAYAVGINTGWDFIDLLIETKALDNLTQDIGPKHTNHYTGLVGRNACHFAPYSWYRWEQFYLIARNLAVQAHQAGDASTKAELTYRAWLNHGYADHFLQDSFAAGHLVNKTLVMQWFIDWAADKWYVPLADWDMVKTMTASHQPGLAAQGLYNPTNPGSVRDPQTAEEQATLQARMNTCGVRADGHTSQHGAYLNYLAFLNSTVVQSASGVLHDHFNDTSLWVTSADHSTPYQIWGDDTMLNGGDGVEIASTTAHLSQQSIVDILNTGATSITEQAIRNRFPTHVRNAGQMYPLQAWHGRIRGVADDLFESVHYYVRRTMPRIGHISIDAPDELTLPRFDARAVPAVPVPARAPVDVRPEPAPVN